MSKRVVPPSVSGSTLRPHKKSRTQPIFTPNKIATAEAAAAVDADPPLQKLIETMNSGLKKPSKGQCVVYWMRMGDLRISDNRALSQASEQAKQDNVPLVVLFILSPQDYIAHDRSSRRIDFALRNLTVIKASLADLHIPLHVITHDNRRTLPSTLNTLLQSFDSTWLFANIEYEIDELRRDIAVCTLAKERSIKVVFVHDRCLVEPGVIHTKEGKTYTVYSPYQRTWLSTVNANIPYYLENCSMPHANASSVRSSGKFGPLFDTLVPVSVIGFELSEGDKRMMDEIWPAGENVALKILNRFLHTKSRPSQLGSVDPLAAGEETSLKHSRILRYNGDRDRGDRDTTSRLSPYLSAGIISARTCVRATMTFLGISHVDAGRATGVGRWVQELAWRDFYTRILASFPRVSMGRPFLEKFAAVTWEDPGEDDGDDGALKRWEEGKTGVPIVDAAMRCVSQTGWVHNRMRMISAMYLTKDLMLDWRLGERFFMRQLIDGDLSSNNGGWQWSASTGTDACPYFRIFNPYTQSLKADPTGDFIRHYVPELANLRGPDLHNPPGSVADKLGYPRPIVNHEEARQRALRRYKNPGVN